MPRSLAVGNSSAVSVTAGTASASADAASSAPTVRACGDSSGTRLSWGTPGRFQAKQVVPRYQALPAAGRKGPSASAGSTGSSPCRRRGPSRGVTASTGKAFSSDEMSRTAWRGARPVRMMSQASSDPTTQLPSVSSTQAPRCGPEKTYRQMALPRLQVTAVLRQKQTCCRQGPAPAGPPC